MGISLHSGPIFENHGSSIHQELWEIVEGGSGNGASLSLSLSLSLSMCALWGDFITGDRGRFVEKAVNTGISFHRGSIWEPKRGLIYQGL